VVSFSSNRYSQSGGVGLFVGLKTVSVGVRVLSVPTTGVLPLVGRDVGDVGRLLNVGRLLLEGLPVGRLLEVGRRLVVGASVGLNVGFPPTSKRLLLFGPIDDLTPSMKKEIPIEVTVGVLVGEGVVG